MLENGMRRLERLGINEREKKKITLTSYKFCISTLLSTPETQYACMIWFKPNVSPNPTQPNQTKLTYLRSQMVKSVLVVVVEKRK